MPLPLHVDWDVLCKNKASRQGPSSLLGTTERATAKRKLADLHKEIDRTEVGTGRVTLANLCERYMATVLNQRPKTLKRKHHIHARLLADFPGGAEVSAGKVLSSQVSAWLASHEFGEASSNLFH